MNGANIFAQLKFAKSRGQLLPKYITIITNTYCVSGVCNVEGDVVFYHHKCQLIVCTVYKQYLHT